LFLSEFGNLKRPLLLSSSALGLSQLGYEGRQVGDDVVGSARPCLLGCTGIKWDIKGLWVLAFITSLIQSILVHLELDISAGIFFNVQLCSWKLSREDNRVEVEQVIAYLLMESGVTLLDSDLDALVPGGTFR
jgi:hypothetical protein